MSTQLHLRRIACNYAVGTKTAAMGALAYVILSNPDNARDRLYILLRSKNGRWVAKWELMSRLANFRVKTISPASPLYVKLIDGCDESKLLPILGTMAVNITPSDSEREMQI